MAPLGMAMALALAALGVYRTLPFLLSHFHGQTDSDRELHHVYESRDYLITFSVWLIAFVLYVPLTFTSARIRTRWKPLYTVICLVAACVFMGMFILHFGNRQFGAYDLGILIDTGWRQIIGQRPYVDFLTANPPGFNLGIKYAFRVFGINWNAQLYATAIFATGSFLWLYWLLCRLIGRRTVAFWLAFAAETAITLELSFWWYNSSTETFVLLFFLSCMLLCRQPCSVGAQISYYFSLWPLGLMKPNMAGIVILCGVALVLCGTGRKLRVTLLTLAAAATVLLFLYINGVSIPSMLASYHGAAIEHGLTLFGLRFYSDKELVVLLLWTLIMALPIVTVLPACRSSLRQRQWRGLAFQLFFPTILLVTLYGLITNSDLADMQIANLLVGGIIILFGIGMPVPPPIMRRIYIALLFAMLASDLYAATTRYRVYAISPHLFFEWEDADYGSSSAFFKDMHASPRMNLVIGQIGQAVSENQGPFFMGPRIELCYALNRLSSPDRMPVGWDPGVSFARRDQGRLLQIWQEHRFQTLIFLKDEYPYYPPEFLSLIRSNYSSDDKYSELTIYHARRQ